MGNPALTIGKLITTLLPHSCRFFELSSLLDYSSLLIKIGIYILVSLSGGFGRPSWTFPYEIILSAFRR